MASQTTQGDVCPGRDRLQGIVEMDGTVIGGIHEGRLGRGDPRKSQVLAAAEEVNGRIGRIRLACIPDAFGKRFQQTRLR